MNKQSWLAGLMTATAALSLFLSGCSEESPEQAAIRQQQEVTQGLRQANESIYAGDAAQAIATLEDLNTTYPDDPAVLETLGFAYAANEQHTDASEAFTRSAELDANRAQNFLYAAQAHRQAGNAPRSAAAYALYLQQFPNDALAWEEQARVLTQLNQPKEALDAYLQAMRRTEGDPDAEKKTEIGRLFLQLGNYAQAEIWLKDALDDPGAESIRPQALVALLESHYARKDWNAADKTLTLLDEEAPGVLEMTDMAFARAELERWRKAREELTSGPKVAVSDDSAEEQSPSADNDAEAQNPKPTPGSKEDLSPDPEIETTAEAGQEAATEDDPPAVTAAEDTDTADTNEPETGDDEVIPPTPLAGDEIAVEDDVSVDSVTEIIIGEETVEEEQPTASIARGDAAFGASNYAAAISNYRQVLVRNYQNAPVWNKLAESYFAAGEFINAEMASLQAIDLQPANVEYRLQYLKAVQKTRNAERLMSELKRAARQIPDSPEIAFALATGYERVEKNPRNAVFYYERFLELAPANHPRSETARQAIRRLSR